MWIIQNTKELHQELEYNVHFRIPPEQQEQDKMLILELEA